MDESDTKSCAACGSGWRLPLLLVPVLVIVALIARSRATRETTHATVQRPAGQASIDAGKTFSLAVDFGDGRRDYGALAWHAGMTVRDAIAAAGDGADGVKFSQQGSGETAFLTEIDGVKNEGGGGRNWTYTVNGKYADRSFAVYELSPGDQVLWTFAGQK